MQVVLLGVYLFLLFFIALVGRELLPWLNTLVLWGVGPLVTVIIVTTRWNRLKNIPKEYLFFLLLVPIALIGYFQVDYSAGYWRYFRSLFTNAVLFILPFLVVRKKEDWYYLIKVILISAFLSVISAHFYTAKDYDFEVTQRLSGLHTNANGVASYARVSILFSLLLLMNKIKGIGRITLWAVVIFSFYTILLTASRGGFVNSLLVILLFGFITLGAKRVIVFIAPVLVLLSLYLGSLVASRFEEFYLFERITRNESVNELIDNESRIDLYKSTWQQFLDYPVFGSGLYQYIERGSGMMSHTDFLDIAVQLGILGLVFYLAIYLNLYSKMINRLPGSHGLRRQELLWLIVVLSSEIIYGFTNPNWFSQLQIIILSLVVIYANNVWRRVW